MTEISITLEAKLLWKKQETELNSCDGCGDIIFGDEHACFARLDIPAKHEHLIKLPYHFCDSCFSHLKEMVV